MNELAGPAWDLSSEYTSTDDPRIDTDLAQMSELMDRIEEANEDVLPYLDVDASFKRADDKRILESLWTILDLGEQAAMLLNNVSTYCNCLLSVNGLDEKARTLEGRLTAYDVRYLEVIQPSKQCLKVAPDTFIEQYLTNEQASQTAFKLNHERKLRNQMLPIQQENLVNGLSQDGIHAWGKLYDQLSSTLQCEVTDAGSTRTVGIAEAASLTQSTNDATREDAWRAINRSWSNHTESCAAAINAIAGWKLEMCRRRSQKNEVHYLDSAVHANHYNRDSLDAIIQVARDSKPLARRAAKAMARAYGKERYGPWDQRAPAPALEGASDEFPFLKGLQVVADSYGKVDPTMGEFVTMMGERAWIEGRLGGSKRPGAYCTSFDKSRTPRVYMTYGGSMSDITVLAHELGHAYHHWLIKDLPKAQQNYGMSLAETASTFGETLVRDALFTEATSPAAKLQIAWEEIAAVVSFLLNIPTRYEFERAFHDARQERPLLPNELKELMASAWIDWYGDSLSEPDEMFWVNKLHFYISGLSFYNFPYLFGYLFSQSIYQRRSEMGEDFFDCYQAILHDTGRMSAEDLVSKHLNADISQTQFWQQTVDALEPRINEFENLCDELGM